MGGVSRVMHGLDPAIVRHSENIAMPGMSFALQYEMLKEILQEKCNLELYLTGISPSHITGFTDYRFLVNFKAKNVFDFAYPIMSLKEMSRFKIAPKRFLKAFLRNCVTPNIEYYKNYFRSNGEDGFPYIGSFTEYCGSDLEDEYTLSRINKHFYWKDTVVRPSLIDIDYLDSIAIVCEKNGLQLILLNSPVHRNYNAKVPEVYLNTYKALVNRMERDYDHVKILDYSNLEIPDECFRDCDHLNADGALLLSSELSRDLEKL